MLLEVDITCNLWCKETHVSCESLKIKWAPTIGCRSKLLGFWKLRFNPNWISETEIPYKRWDVVTFSPNSLHVLDFDKGDASVLQDIGSAPNDISWCRYDIPHTVRCSRVILPGCGWPCTQTRGHLEIGCSEAVHSIDLASRDCKNPFRLVQAENLNAQSVEAYVDWLDQLMSIDDAMVWWCGMFKSTSARHMTRFNLACREIFHVFFQHSLINGMFLCLTCAVRDFSWLSAANCCMTTLFLRWLLNSACVNPTADAKMGGSWLSCIAGDL